MIENTKINKTAKTAFQETSQIFLNLVKLPHIKQKNSLQ